MQGVCLDKPAAAAPPEFAFSLAGAAPLPDRRTARRRLVLCAALALPQLVLTLGVPLPGSPAQQAFWRGLLALFLSAGALAASGAAFWAAAWREARELPGGKATGAALLPGAAVLLCLGGGVGLTAAAALGVPDAEGSPLFLVATLTLAARSGGQLWLLRLQRQAGERFCHAAPALPDSVQLVREDGELTAPAAALQPGEVFLTAPGERFAADGLVEAGSASAEESLLTGSADPVGKVKGSAVYAGTVNLGPDALRASATAVGGGTRAQTAAAAALRAAQTAPADTPRAALLRRWLAPGVLALALLSLALWLAAGAAFGTAAARAAAVLLAASPPALLLALPAALSGALLAGARQGMLFADAAALQTAGALAGVLAVKDGVVSSGEPQVVSLTGTRQVPGKFLLGLAAGLETYLDDPVALAVLKKAQAEGIKVRPVAAFAAADGGVTGQVAGKAVAGGSAAFVAAQCGQPLPNDLLDAGAALTMAGAAPLYFSLDRHPAGVLGVAEAVDPASRDAIGRLRALLPAVRVLAPESPAGAAHLADQLGLPEEGVQPGVTGDGLAGAVAAQKSALGGPVALVAKTALPAFAAADLGVALSDAAPGAGLVLLRGRLGGLPAAVVLARAAAKAGRRAEVAAALYHLAALPLAMGLLAPLCGLVLPGWLAALLWLAGGMAAGGGVIGWALGAVRAPAGPDVPGGKSAGGDTEAGEAAANPTPAPAPEVRP